MNSKVVAICIVLFALCHQNSYAQKNTNEGEVSFTTSSNIYVRFTSTEKIAVGDTLFRQEGNQLTPCMVVAQKSSNSTVNKSLNGCLPKIGDKVFFDKKIVFSEKDEEEVIPIIDEPLEKPLSEEAIEEDATSSLYKQKIRARLSLATYSNLSSFGDDDRHRIMLRGNINARNINNSKFSFESYVNFRENILKPGINPNGQTRFFRLYNLALTYDVNPTMHISVGRKINRKISSIGSIDGLQIEKHFGNFYVGAVGGFKPDLFKFDFNSELLQYGGYIGLSSNKRNLYSQSTIGVLEQKNGMAVDRRYAYFQHSSTINRKLTLFGSAEVDLYQRINETASTTPRLTNLYVSSRYRFNKILSLTLSYDTRKRIIYYETLRTEVENILADDQARQGLRGRLNIQPIRYLNVGGSYSRRFQSNGDNKSDNINVFVSHSKLPFVGGRLSFNANQNESNYLRTRIVGARYGRSIIKRKLNADFYYRMVEHQYIGNVSKTTQHFFGTSFRWRLNKKLSLSILGELAQRSTRGNYRFNTRLIKRF